MITTVETKWKATLFSDIQGGICRKELYGSTLGNSQKIFLSRKRQTFEVSNCTECLKLLETYWWGSSFSNLECQEIRHTCKGLPPSLHMYLSPRLMSFIELQGCCRQTRFKVAPPLPLIIIQCGATTYFQSGAFRVKFHWYIVQSVKLQTTRVLNILFGV